VGIKYGTVLHVRGSFTNLKLFQNFSISFSIFTFPFSFVLLQRAAMLALQELY